MNFTADNDAAHAARRHRRHLGRQPSRRSRRRRSPTAPPDKRRANLRPLASLLPYVKRYRGRALAALGALVVAALTTLIVPIAVRRMIDFGFTARGVELIDSYFLVMIAVAALLALASASRYFLVTTLGERIVADLRGDVFAHLTSLSADFFDEAKTGEVISRLTADTTQIKAAVGSSVSVALRNVVLFVGASAMMVVTSPRLSAFVLGAIPIIVLPLYAFGRAVRRRSRSAQDTLADASAYAAELIGAVRVLQAFTNERLGIARFRAAVERAFDAARDSIRARAILTAFAIFLVSTSVVLVLWVGAQDVLAGHMTPGRLSQFILYAVLAAGALGSLSETGGEMAQASGAAERLFEILAIKPAIARPPHPAALPLPARGEVAFEDVRFSYPTRPNVSALDGVSFHVRQGEKVAIVGPSGAGKSTIFHLLLRFYDPIAGRVTLDGVRLADLDPADLRSRIALVPQDSVMFATSVRDNIRFGRPRGERRRRGARRRTGARGGLHRGAAAKARHAGRRARRHAVGRPAPAHRHRARHFARRAAAAARRGDVVARCRKRDPDCRGARRADAHAHHAGHRPSARDGAVLRPHSGARRRPHRRGGHAPDAGRARRPLCAAGEAAVSGGLISWPPAHAMHRLAGNRILAGASDEKSEPAVKADGADIVDVDVEIEAGRRYALGFGDQRRADAGAPMLRRHHDLVEIKRARIDRDEADHRAAGFRDHDFGYRQKLVAPALAPPVEPLGEIKLRIGFCQVRSHSATEASSSRGW